MRIRAGSRGLARPVAAGLLALAGVLAQAGPPAAAAGAGTARAAVADPRDARDRADAELAEAAATLEYATERAQRAGARYARANAKLPGAEARASRARGEVAAARALAATAEREAARAEQELAAAEGRFRTSVDQVDRARQDVATFAVAAYKSSRLGGFHLMLQARGPAEAIERLGYLDHVAGVERAAVDDLVAARLRAKQAENEATLAHERAESARAATAAALARAEAAAAAAEAAAADAAALVETREEALATAEAEREESLRRYRQAEAEAARVEAELRAWQASRPAPEQPAGSSSADLLLPTQGWQSSPFGNRFDPFFRVWQLHAGVDIAAPGGAPIRAAAGGTVIRAGWNGGYGNFTCLGHGSYRGQGLSTCYAHQSAILVGPGQWVDRGEVIGRVGTTGASTGNHLHFEVRLDGAPTDPVPFLPPF